MIYFYRSIRPFYAITVDLDNTLYDNNPVISRAEEKLVLFLKKYHPLLSKIEKQDCYIARKIIKLIDPEIYHDVNYWRWKSLEYVLLKYGLSRADAQLGADCGMDIIIHWRNKIDISIRTNKVLLALRSKWPLIAITNGNADPILFGLKKYFSDVLRSGIHGRAKPYQDMYYLASKYFGLPCKYILHIGDNLEIDVQGALCSGMQACWINQYNLNQKDRLLVNLKFCPNIKISELMSLTYLI